MEKTTATPVDECPVTTPSYRITRGLTKEFGPATGDSKIALAIVLDVLSACVTDDWAHRCAQYPPARHNNLKKKCFAGISCFSTGTRFNLGQNVLANRFWANLVRVT